MNKTLLLSVAAGVVLFVWGFISWALLPWHNMVAHKFTDETTVSQVLKTNAPQQGVYYLPFAEEDHKPGETAAFVNVLPQGFDMNMGKLMGIGLVTQIISAFLVLCLLGMTGNPNYWGKVGFFALTGLVIGFVSHAPYWNWFGFSASYVGVVILDGVIAWTLAGLAVAKFAQGKA